MENILISLCLVGIDCKYNGGNNLIDQLDELKQKYNLIPFCPEITGGMPTPRLSVEIVNGRVVNHLGEDYTKEFEKGARDALKIAKMLDCKKAILQVRSPSCGYGRIYDGTFSGRLKEGNGVTAALLEANGIEIYPSDEIARLLED